jgi:hypothetical protein
MRISEEREPQAEYTKRVGDPGIVMFSGTALRFSAARRWQALQ